MYTGDIKYINNYMKESKHNVEESKMVPGENFVGTPGRIRTCGLRIRSPLLYPAELQAHNLDKNESCVTYIFK